MWTLTAECSFTSVQSDQAFSIVLVYLQQSGQILKNVLTSNKGHDQSVCFHQLGCILTNCKLHLTQVFTQA